MASLTMPGPEGKEVPLDVCPGWLVRQPAAVEGSYACAVAKNGDLTAYFPGCENPIMEAAAEMAAVWNTYELALHERTAMKGRNG